MNDRARAVPPRSRHREQPRRRWLVAVALAWLAGAGGCIDDTITTPSAHKSSVPGDKDAILVVATDYASTSLSWVNASLLSVTRAGFLHSGSAVSASGAALSGDVIPGSDALADGRFPVVDRSQSSITWVGGDTISQWPVSDGFQANPQDVWRLGDEVFVVRAQPDPTPTDALLSGGDDLLVLDVLGTPIGRVALAQEATLPGAMAFGGRGARLGARLWLPLASFLPDFTAVGPGRVIEIDLAARAVTRRIDIPSLENCTTTRAAGDSLIGTCSGFFQDLPAAQRAHSGVYRVLAASGVATVVLTGEAIGGVIGFPIANDGDKRGWIVRLGRLSAPGRADEVWRFDPSGEAQPTRVWIGSRAFAIGALWYDAARHHLWVSDAAGKTGDLVVLDVGAAPSTDVRPARDPPVVARIMTQPGGLPAVYLAAVRAP